MANETILIVEDEWILSMNLQNILKSMGYRVLEPVGSGEDAIESVSAHHPDLILMDITLAGEMTGIEASRHITAVTDVPIIFLTSHGDEKFVQEAKSALPYGYLIKPVFERDLAITIEMALNRYLLDRCLRESEERFRNLFQNVASVAVVGYGEDCAIRYWNRAAEEIFGYTAQETIGRNFIELIIPPDKQMGARQAVHQMAVSGKAFSASQRILMRKDGSLVPVFSSYTILNNPERDPELFTIDIDLSENKRIEKENAALEDQNRQLQKAESLSRMAGAIAHHFNNMLGAAMGNVEIALMDLPADSAIADSLNEAMKACNKAAEVSTLMLTYLGQSLGRKEVVNLSDICVHCLSMLRVMVPDNLAVEHDFSVSDLAVRANTNQIRQLLTNLVSNAYESIAQTQGSIGLVLKRVLPTEISETHRFPVNWCPQDTPYACIEVQDTGCGIPAADIDKLFDPFFTTKFMGRGLGLPVILGIVKSHQGGITVESEPGKGSVFRVYLPILAETITTVSQKTEAPLPSASGGTVLLVEDGDMMRLIFKSMLQRLGYAVIEAKDGAEAVELFKRHQATVRFVLSDLTMPNMDGWETLTALRKISPDVSVILSSGYDEGHVMAGEHPERPNAFLGKPYRIDELDRTIRRVLSETK